MTNQCPSFHYTPKEVIEKIFSDIDFKDNDSVLEPCVGRDKNMFDLIPDIVDLKEWGEIELGRDIFEYDYGRKFSKVLVNPPYKDNNNEKNIAMKFIFRCLELCSDECWLLLNNKMFNSLTPIRLKKMKELGFELTHLRILNIPKWYGRYYWICLKKGGQSLVKF